MTDDASANSSGLGSNGGTVEGPFPAADRWVATRRRKVLGVLLALAVVLRVFAFCELADSPIADSYRFNQMDMAYFERWAAWIANDDLLGRQPAHPRHQWHSLVAQAHFITHPELLDGKSFLDLNKEQKMAAVTDIWNRWYGGTRYHQEPLYPYLIAAVYTVTQELRFVYLLQMVAGALTIGLLFGVTRRVFGDLAGVLAAGTALGFGPLIHYEMSLLRCSLITMTGLAVVWVAQSLRERPRSRHRVPWLFAFGCLVGLATALKATYAVVACGLLAGVYWPRRREGSAIARELAPICLGAALCLSPVIVRNIIVGAPVLGLSSVAAVTFAGSNFSGYVPKLGWFPFDHPESLAAIMAEGEGRFLATVAATLGTHPSIESYLALLWEKLAQVFHWVELPNNTNFYYSCQHSIVLTVQRHLVAAWWILPLALVGGAVSWRQRRRVGGLTWYAVCCLAPLIVLYTLSRFRVPFVVAMLPFAAFGCLFLADVLRQRRYGTTAVGLIFVVGLAGAMLRPRHITTPLIDLGCYVNAARYHYLPEVNRALSMKDHEAATRTLERLFAHAPPYVRKHDPSLVPKTDATAAALEFFAELYRISANVYKEGCDAGKHQFYTELSARLTKSVEHYRNATGQRAPK